MVDECLLQGNREIVDNDNEGDKFIIFPILVDTPEKGKVEMKVNNSTDTSSVIWLSYSISQVGK